MKLKSTCLALFSLLTFATAQAQVKVGANPGSLTPNATLDAEGSSGARTVIMNDGRVGVSTPTPHTSADLELGSTTKALYLNRVASTSAITAPQPGMVIYDLSANCVKTYQGSPATWSDCLSGSSANAGGSGTVSGLSCSSASFSPSSATANTPYSGTLTVPYTGGNGGTYTAQSVTQNWLSVSLPAGSFASGSGNIYYTISGTPTSSGSVSVSLSVGGQSCAPGSIPALPVNAAPPSIPTGSGSGSLNGRTCFDIAESNNVNSCGALSGRTANRANFNLAATYSQTYVFTPTGTVSNVRFVYVNTNGQVIQSLTPSANYSGTLSSGSSASAVAAYNQDLSSDNPSSPSNGLALGRSISEALTADIYVIYNDGSEDKKLKLTANVKDCACCGAYVAAGVWKQFMCHNLRADYTADPFTPAAAIHGAKYQWGSTGSSTTSNGNTTVTWITQAYDQQYSAPVSNWNGSFSHVYIWNAGSETYPYKNMYDPCPAGYRVPTNAEFLGLANNSLNPQTKIGSFTSSPTNYGTAYKLGDFLMLPVAGFRASNSGQLANRGSVGFYWSSTSAGTVNNDANQSDDAYILYLDSTSARRIASQNNGATGGGSIRCITE